MTIFVIGCASQARALSDPNPPPTIAVVATPTASVAEPVSAPEAPPPDPCHVDEELTHAHDAMAEPTELSDWLAQARSRLFAPDVAQRELGGIAQEVVSLLAHRRYDKLVDFTTTKGLCLRARKGAPCETLAAEDLATCGHSQKRKTWSLGKGQEPSPEYTCGEAFPKIFYARDFLRKAAVHFNCFPESGRGSNGSPVVLSRPARGYVEFHDPGGSDGIWRSLWLVFDGEPGAPVLVEMISEY